MKTQSNLDKYERIMFALVIIATAITILCSCSSSRTTRRDPVRTPDAWRKVDNGGCGWNR